MSRRADPERIYQARRSAVFRKLTATGAIDELDAQHWIAAWERSPQAELADRLTPEFWEAGELWILSSRLARRD